MADVYQISYDGQNTWVEQGVGFNSVAANLTTLASNGLYERTVRDGCAGTAQLVPNPPTASDGSLTVVEGGSQTLDLDTLASDPFQGSLAYVVNIHPTAGTASIAGSTLTYNASTAGVTGAITMIIQAVTLRGESVLLTITANISTADLATVPVINGFTNIGNTGEERAQVDTCGTTGTQLQAGIDKGNTGTIDFMKLPQNNSGCDFVELAYQGTFFIGETGDRLIVRSSNNSFADYNEVSFVVS